MIATITAALMSLYAAATAHDESIVHRIHDATIGLVLLDRQMVGSTAYAVVPEIMYREYKALYLTLRRDHLGSAGRLALPHGLPSHLHAVRLGRIRESYNNHETLRKLVGRARRATAA